MMTLRGAKTHAARVEAATGVKHVVIKTHPEAWCNQYPANIYNKGPYATCAAAELEYYTAHGAQEVQS